MRILSWRGHFRSAVAAGATVIAAGAACTRSAPAPGSRPPNVILIMADDLGYAELGSYGQEKIRTPHLDRMAAEGMRFTQFYSGHPVCAPSRATLLTGLHTGHAPVRGNLRVEYVAADGRPAEGNLPLPADTRTLGRMLKERGYTTAAMGKWGLGGPGSTGEPILHGIDLFYGYLDQKHAHNYYPDHLWLGSERGLVRDSLRNESIVAHGKLEGDPSDPASYAAFQGVDYAPDRMTERALEFMRDNRERPFFLYLPYTIPHAALQVPDEELEPYAFPEIPYGGQNGYAPHPRPRAAYAGMISRLDGYVGRVLALVEELGLDENTLVLFTSDNGTTYNGGVDASFFESVGNLRGLKNSVYEGGIRVPMIAWWPGRIAAGSTSDHVAANWDLLPTLVEASGATAPAEIDGISFLPTLLGGRPEQQQHDYLYWENPGPCGGQQALRMGDWKAVRLRAYSDRPGRIELYDLSADAGETQDVSARHPDLVRQIRGLMREAHAPSAVDQWNIDLAASDREAGAAPRTGTCTHASVRRSAPAP